MSMFEAVPTPPFGTPVTPTNSMEMKKLLIDSTAQEAFDFLMKAEQYHSLEPPSYFDFNPVLDFVRETIGDQSYEKCLATRKPKPEELGGVNLDLLLNKDGRYGVRPLTLTNPYLYYFLVRELCSEENWKRLQEAFQRFTVPHITACAQPLIPLKKEQFHNATPILNWWHKVEQRSMELSLEYRYMFATDITNCYGSINPASFEWALNCRNTKLQHDANTDLANNIQKYLKAMQRGCNIGIPQGSTLFDFLSEIVLGYSDLLLHNMLKKNRISGYEIIRFRDDYRIFCNNKDTLERISYILQHVLESLNFRMNTQKTKISDSVVTDAVKPDKRWYIYNTPILSKKGCDFDSFQKHLFYILMFSRDYPNSGQVRRMLNELDKRITLRLEEWEVQDKAREEREGLCDEVTLDEADIKAAVEDLEEAQKELKENPNIFDNAKVYSVPSTYERLSDIKAIVAIATQIAIENVQSSHYALRIVSRLVNTMKDLGEKDRLIHLVCQRLGAQPNSDYLQLWLQDLNYMISDKDLRISYSMPLCQLKDDEDNRKNVKLWNCDWLLKKLTEDLPYYKIVGREQPYSFDLDEVYSYDDDYPSFL